MTRIKHVVTWRRNPYGGIKSPEIEQVKDTMDLNSLHVVRGAFLIDLLPLTVDSWPEACRAGDLDNWDNAEALEQSLFFYDLGVEAALDSAMDSTDAELWRRS